MGGDGEDDERGGGDVVKGVGRERVGGSVGVLRGKRAEGCGAISGLGSQRSKTGSAGDGGALGICAGRCGRTVDSLPARRGVSQAASAGPGARREEVGPIPWPLALYT